MTWLVLAWQIFKAINVIVHSQFMGIVILLQCLFVHGLVIALPTALPLEFQLQHPLDQPAPIH